MWLTFKMISFSLLSSREGTACCQYLVDHKVKFVVDLQFAESRLGLVISCDQQCSQVAMQADGPDRHHAFNAIWWAPL